MEYEIVLELSSEFPVLLLWETMGIQRSSFYHWKKRLTNPAPKTKALADNIILFWEYHIKYPSHGYRWLNAKIKLDTGLNVSDPYAHKCCRLAGIKNKLKHYRYKRPSEPRKVYPNLLLAGIDIDGPTQCIVSDMTAFHVKGIYYELTLYMDLWNNEILSRLLSAKCRDRMTYIIGLNDLIELKKQYLEYQTVPHSNQGSVYASKNYNDLLGPCCIIYSMSRAGTPTDNAAMESINGWIKSELFTNFHLQGENVQEEMEAYIKFFNEERPAYSLGYLTPKRYRETYAAIQ
ncbi:transposase [Lachnospiraceae bacterium MD335]|nr:transposase [Lachnospiraceae bacterium MD335]